MVDTLHLPTACFCRAVRFLAPVARERTWLSCHCVDCRRSHGSAFAVLCPLEATKEALHGPLGVLKEGPLSICSGLEGSLNASVRRHFCQKCGSSCLVSLHVDGKARCFLLAAGVLADKEFPKGFVPDMQELATQSPALFGPMAVPFLSQRGTPATPAVGSCQCGRCRFRCRSSPREFQHCHCSMCRKMSGSAFQTWTPLRREELEWHRPNALRTLRSSRHAVREFCQECGSSMTILYSSQKGTLWVSAAAFDKTSFLGAIDRQQAIHICCDSAPPWHPPERWHRDGLRRVGDVSEDGEDMPTVAQRFLDEGAVDSDEERLQQALQLSRAQAFGVEGASSSSSSRAPPEALALQELAGCTVEAAEEALRNYGSADAAAEALLGGAPEAQSQAELSSVSEARRPQPQKRLLPGAGVEEAKRPASASVGSSLRGARAAGTFSHPLRGFSAATDFDD
mmetsp:Transcript_48007/g.107735  ORF Transcript_48007/g.107735 Transcript_48007/m.107735 type:complete len:454 (+) Transcript_48007:39-1400(+)